MPDADLPDDDDDVRLAERRGRILFGILLGIVAAAVIGVALFAMRGNSTEERALTAEGQRDETAALAVDLSQQVLAECDAGRLIGPLCDAARGIVEEPIPPVAPRDGADGRPGRDGRDGVDGVSPPCLAEPSMCRGADAPPGRDGVDGTDGQDGQDGQDGTDGAPGEPPAGFTFTDGDGRRQNCTRDPGSPDDSATYTCTAAVEDGGEPTVMNLTLLR